MPSDEHLRVKPPEESAVGFPAVAHSVEYAWQEMGPSRGVRTLLRMNQVDGFDCPSCAWPDPQHRKIAEFCENGAKAVAWEATRKRVGPDFFAEHSVEELRGESDHELEHHGRLTSPMYIGPGDSHYRPIDWDDAIALVADRLKALPDPNRAAFYTSGRASNEAAFVYQLLARRLGTNNLPDCSNMCHESSGAALSETIGIGKGTVTIEDISDHADLIVIVGQNPGTNHPRMLTSLEEAKRRGARIVAINPLPEAAFDRYRNPQTVRGMLGRGTVLADSYLPVRLNGDLAFFAGVNKSLIAREDVAPGTVLDHDFIDTHCAGFDAAVAAWRTLDWDRLTVMSGLSRQQMEDFAELTIQSQNVIVCWAMGLTQHKNSVPTIREVMNFLLLRGNIGRPGAGPSPIRGHSNVQGDRTMGVWEKMPDTFLASLEAEFGFEPPRKHGFDTVDAIRAMRDEKIDVFFALGGNFASATPDTRLTEAALESCALTVHVSTKLNRSHLCHGREGLILPCLGRTERDVQPSGVQFVTVEDSMSMVHTSRGRLTPGSAQLRSEVKIVTDLGHALFGEDLGWRVMGEDYRVIRRHIERVVPGFHAFEERVQQPGGFMLPRPPHDSRSFATANGKANFTVNPPTAVQAPDGHLVLQTMRSHDQFNTTVYGLNDRYRGVHGGRRVVFVNADDLRAQGVADGAVVDLVSIDEHRVERRAPRFRVIAYPTPSGCAAAYFPEANALVPVDSVAETSNTPTSKSVIIRLDPVTAASVETDGAQQVQADVR